jgi:hypothetical protein
MKLFDALPLRVKTNKTIKNTLPTIKEYLNEQAVGSTSLDDLLQFIRAKLKPIGFKESKGGHYYMFSDNNDPLNDFTIIITIHSESFEKDITVSGASKREIESTSLADPTKRYQTTSATRITWKRGSMNSRFTDMSKAQKKIDAFITKYILTKDDIK